MITICCYWFGKSQQCYLLKYIPKPWISDVYLSFLKESYNPQTKSKQNERRVLLSQIDELNNRLKNARGMVADQKLDVNDFREIKIDCMNKISILESKLSSATDAPKSIDSLLNKAIDNLGNLDKLYERGTVKQQRQIISSIYPEKLTFDGFHYRTLCINEAVRLIYSLGEDFREIKNRKSGNKLHLSGKVARTRIELVIHP